MLSAKNVMIIGSVIVIFVILQTILILFSSKVNSPAEAAVEFTKAYFMLDGTSMTENLCSEISEGEEADIVGGYLFHAAEQARAMGFSPGYMKNQLSGVHTEINMMDQNSAKVRITGDRLRSINPVFAFVGRLFFLIETHKFDETLTLVKEDGKWRVCSKPFSLSEI
ncbi:MAG: hypothetical protein GQ571_13095 [Desulfobacterales bacterium]|jgi:hypothetical protein|nr:hypothetical protein [Desulfobacterales bacterium]